MKERNIFKRLIFEYERLSIHKMIAITFTIISIIGMCSVIGALYYKYVNSTKQIIVKNTESIIDQVNINLDNYLRSMMKISNSAYYGIIKKADFKKQNIEDQINLIYDTNKDSIISICVFTDDGKLVSSFPDAELKVTAVPYNEGWFKKALISRENIHFSTPHVQNLFNDPNYSYHWVVSLSRSVDLTFNGKTRSGILLVDMDFKSIERILSSQNNDKGKYMYIIDNDGEIVYHPKQHLIYSNLIRENNRKAAHYEDGVHSENYNGQKRFVTVKTMGYTGWKIVYVTPMSNIISGYKDMKIFVVFVLMFSILILILINMFVSAKITNPIIDLEQKVKRLEDGVKDVEFSSSGSYEIVHLGQVIQSMVKQLHKLMDNIVIEQEAKRKSELNALQAQINPHFLYNTLDSIIWMIENENYQGAIEMVSALARLFRISLSKGRNIITLKDELEHAENYLKIQSIRYKNKFVYKFDIQDGILDMMSIKLIIQPLIENAIYHGVEYMDGDGVILIKAYTEDGDLYIDVTDNGLGMEQDDADKLLESSTTIKSKKGSGSGLKNVNARIKLYCGIDYGLLIFSEPDEGTTIRIHMPCIDYTDIQDRGV